MSAARIDDLVAELAAYTGASEIDTTVIRGLLDSAYTRGWTDSLDELDRRMARKSEVSHA